MIKDQIKIIQDLLKQANLPKGRYNIDFEVILEGSDKVVQPIPTIQCREKRISGQILEILEQWVFNGRKHINWHRIRISSKERLEYLECPIHSGEMEQVVKELNKLNSQKPSITEIDLGHGLYAIHNGPLSIYDVKRR